MPLTLSFGKELIHAAERKKAAGVKSDRGDLKWESRSCTLYPAICFGCGIAAGALGIAAGMVLSPILLELGMIPAVAAATSGFTVLFTSSCTRCAARRGGCSVKKCNGLVLGVAWEMRRCGRGCVSQKM